MCGTLLISIHDFFDTLVICSYSWNEGETWLTYKFLNNTRMHVYGLLTEPGEQSAQFTIFGSYPGWHKWVVVQIDLKDVLGRLNTVIMMMMVISFIELKLH